VLKLARRAPEATPEFLAAAEAGLPRAQYFAGAAYATGAGVERDLVAAITWWTRAAEQGVAQADESLVQLRQAASGRSRRTPAERQAVEQAFGEYRARLWKDYPGLTREGDEPLGPAAGRRRDADRGRRLARRGRQRHRARLVGVRPLAPLSRAGGGHATAGHRRARSLERGALRRGRLGPHDARARGRGTRPRRRRGRRPRRPARDTERAGPRRRRERRAARPGRPDR